MMKTALVYYLSALSFGFLLITLTNDRVLTSLLLIAVILMFILFEIIEINNRR